MPLGFFTGRRRAVVSVVHLRGLISSGRFGSVNLERCERALEAAFRGLWRAPDAVAVNVNSPGGSPVQSALLYRRIRELAGQRNTKVLTFAGARARMLLRVARWRAGVAARVSRECCGAAARARKVAVRVRALPH
jgi:hypothetical protein